MVNFVGKINGISLYSDETIEINKIFYDQKQVMGDNITLILTHPETAQLIFIGNRIQKIQKIKERISKNIIS